MEIEENLKYGGWENCIRLTNGEVEGIITTNVGPRIIRFAFIGDKNLFGEMKQQYGKTGGNEWLVYGGHRFWHAPEVLPRTYFPDNNPVNYQWNGKTLKLIQVIENTTGIQKEIEVTPGQAKNHIRVLHRLVNKNIWDIELAPWAVTVMTKNGRAIIPQEPHRTGEGSLLPVRPLVLWPYTEMNDRRFIWGNRFIQIKQDPDAKTAQKIGVLNTLGWVAYYVNGQLFIKRYRFDPEAQYPDFGANTEVYSNPDLLEIETLGSMKKLSPGGSTEHLEDWFLFKTSLREEEGLMESELTTFIKKTDVNI